MGYESMGSELMAYFISAALKVEVSWPTRVYSLEAVAQLSANPSERWLWDISQGTAASAAVTVAMGLRAHQKDTFHISYTNMKASLLKTCRAPSEHVTHTLGGY